MTTLYHIFRDNDDEYTYSYDEAVRLFKSWKAQGYNCRLYAEEWEDTSKDDEPVNEHCLMSYGEYPL